MELSESKIFAVLSALGLAGFFVVVAGYDVDPRFADDVLEWREMLLWERVTFVYSMIVIPVTVLVATVDAFSLGHKPWKWLNVLIWPVSFLYVWKAALGGFKQANSKNPT